VGNKNTNRERKQGKVDVKVGINPSWRYMNEGFGTGMVFMLLLWFRGGAMACMG